MLCMDQGTWKQLSLSSLTEAVPATLYGAMLECPAMLAAFHHSRKATPCCCPRIWSLFVAMCHPQLLTLNSPQYPRSKGATTQPLWPYIHRSCSVYFMKYLRLEKDLPIQTSTLMSTLSSIKPATVSSSSCIFHFRGHNMCLC